MMKKMLFCLIFMVSLACNDNGSSNLYDIKNVDKVEVSKTQALLKDEAFVKKFNILMNIYFHLKDNFILRKTDYVRIYCQQMQIESQKLSFYDVSGDTLARGYPAHNFDDINQALAKMENEKEVVAMLPYFSEISDLVFGLLKNNYAYTDKTYRLYCSKVLAGKGGYWLNRYAFDENPYDPSLLFSCTKVDWTNNGFVK